MHDDIGQPDSPTGRTPRRRRPHPQRSQLDVRAVLGELPDLRDIGDVPPEERAARTREWLRGYEKARRLDKLSRGYGAPRTRKELAVWMDATDRRFGLSDLDDEPDQPA